MRPGEPFAPLRRLRVDLEREAWVFVAELVRGVSDVVAARTTQARVRPAQPVEAEALGDRGDAVGLEGKTYEVQDVDVLTVRFNV